MNATENNETMNEPLIPWYVNGAVAIICAVVLLAMVALGPLGTGSIVYRSSGSAIMQIEGNDITNLFVMVPLLLIGGALALAKKDAAKYFLVLTPITLMYYALSVGIGQEWGNVNYPGTVEHYFWLFLILIIGGLLLLIGSLSMFTNSDAPKFRTKGLRLFVGLTILFLVLFGAMWVMQTMEVINTGDLVDGSYSAAPTSFWVIRYLDLGISIPVGFIALFMMLSKPEKAYRLVLLFFGFFVTTATAVNAMAIMQLVNNDPAARSLGPGIGIFLVLGALSYALLYFMVRDKVVAWRGKDVEESASST
jgi:hypothetical protein